MSPTCLSLIHILVADYLRPTLTQNGIDAKILCWDHSYTTTNYREGSYPLEFYEDADARNAVDGSAWHWYEGDEEVMSVVHKEYPSKDIWFTEEMCIRDRHVRWCCQPCSPSTAFGE